MAVPDELAPYAQLVRNVKIFSYLTDEELIRILSVSEILKTKEGEEVVSQGEISESCFAILEGNVQVSVRELSEKEVFICNIETGEMFGEAGIFMTEKRTANVRAGKDAVLLKIHRTGMMAFFRENPQAANKILMLIVLGLLKKLKNANMDLAIERQSDIDFEYADSLIQDFMEEI